VKISQEDFDDLFPGVVDDFRGYKGFADTPESYLDTFLVY